MGFLKPAAGGFFLENRDFYECAPPPCFRRFGNKGGGRFKGIPLMWMHGKLKFWKIEILVHGKVKFW